MPMNFIYRNHLTKNIPFRLSIVAMFLALGYAAFDSIWSIYIHSFLENPAYVGLFSVALTTIGFLFFFFDTPIIEKYNETSLWLVGAVLLIFSYGLFYVANSFCMIAFVGVLFTVGKSLHYQSRGIILCDSCKKKDLGEAEGILGAMRNVGWLLGPLIGGFTAAKYGVRSVFLFSIVFVLIGIALFRMIKIKDCNHHTKDDATLKSSILNIKKFFKSKKLFTSYFVAGGMPLYWSIIYVFVPLHIMQEGFSGSTIGIFLFAIVIPLVLLEYVVGKNAYRFKFKTLFFYGYIILALCSALAFVFNSIFLSLSFIVLGSIGAAMIETTREHFFFSQVSKSEEEKYFGPFMTHIHTFPFIGKAIVSGFLFLFPLKSTFLILAIIMTLFAFYSMYLKK